MSVAKILREGLFSLFDAINKKDVVLDSCERVSVKSFIQDFCKMTGEIRSKEDVASLWKIDDVLAERIFALFEEVVLETDYNFETTIDSDSSGSGSDTTDFTEDSSEDEMSSSYTSDDNSDTS